MKVFNKMVNEMVKKDFDLHKQSYGDALEYIENSTAIYHGEPVKFTYIPKFFSEEQIEKFDKLTQTTMGILNKVIDEYVANPEYRKKFPFEKELEELIIKEHHYGTRIPIARLDFFYDEDKDTFKFCEYNADGTSAMNEDLELVKAFKLTKAYEMLSEEYVLEDFELFDSWLDQLMIIYDDYKYKVESPTVAILDFTESSSPTEFIRFRDKLEERGYKAKIVDVRQVTFENEYLYHDGDRLDLVYRRLVTTDLYSRRAEIPAFIEACKGSKTCIVGPIKTQVIHNKMIYAVLHDERTKAFLTADEGTFIENHVPMTYELTSSSDLDVNHIKQTKDQWILKPLDLYGSRGVYAGLDWTEEEWVKHVDDCIDKEYLVQEYVMPFEIETMNFDDNEFQKLRQITGVFMYNGKMKGILSRAGRRGVISGLNEGRSMATFVVRNRKRSGSV